ncbi:hypothetical protein, partial [Burkholderia ubonensis]|uniref:hypothetical protein n=1 Tax=Burkholderia ubonensis TaxID=101571 RepID=UPI001E316E7C
PPSHPARPHNEPDSACHGAARHAWRTEKKARLESRADKGLEIFSVNEKVCFGKQRSQYSDITSFHYPCSAQTSIAEATIMTLVQ